jgi:hypothetical protein
MIRHISKLYLSGNYYNRIINLGNFIITAKYYIYIYIYMQETHRVALRPTHASTGSNTATGRFPVDSSAQRG